METNARYFTTIAGQPVQLKDVKFFSPQQADYMDDLQASETLRRVMHEGKLAVGTVGDQGALFEADRCIAYSNSPSRHKCDARCMNATGNQCECSCGGVNHGKGGFDPLDWTALEAVLADEGQGENFDAVPPTKPAMALIGDAAQIGMGKDRSVATLARFRCDNCGGSGRWRPTPWHHRSWECRKCHGKGLLKTDPEVLKAHRLKEAEKRAAARKEYQEQHADVFAWLDAEAAKDRRNGRDLNSFAMSLLQAFNKYGSLTDGQLTAVRRNLERKAAEATRVADVVVVGEGFERIVQAFKAAKASGLKYPKFQVGEYVFQPATARSSHPDAIFVKSGRSFHSAYYGRIANNGDFFAARDCDATQKAAILEICKDPLAAAVMHGKQTGRCSCCGRELENEESVQLGIGPICRKKWGM